MPEIDSLESLQGFLKQEASIRCRGDVEPPTNLTPFSTDLSTVLVVYRNLRHGVASDVHRLDLPEVYKDALSLVPRRQIIVPSVVA